MCPTLCAGLSFLCPTWFCAQACLSCARHGSAQALSFLFVACTEWMILLTISASPAGKTIFGVLHVLQYPSQFTILSLFVACTEITCFWLLCSWFCMFCRQNHFVVLHVLQYPSKCTILVSFVACTEIARLDSAHDFWMFCRQTTFCFWNLANLGHFFHGKSLYFQVEIWQNFLQKIKNCRHGSYTET